MPDTHRVVGRLVKDPDPRQTEAGVQYVQFVIASEHGANKSKNVSYFTCKVWKHVNQFAFNFARKWLKKGYVLDVIGERLVPAPFTKKDGTIGVAMNMNVLAIYSVPAYAEDGKGGSYKGVYRPLLKERPPASPDNDYDAEMEAYIAETSNADADDAPKTKKTGGRKIDDDEAFFADIPWTDDE